MRKPCKPRLKLVPNDKANKEYELLVITLVNDLEIPYDLALWEFYDEKEWIDIVKKDRSAMHSYVIYNIMSVKFERKTTVPVNGPDLKPVA